MNDWQEKRVQEFSSFYGWPVDQVRELFGVSKSFFECIWLGLNPQTREEEEAYYNSPWLTLRQMSYSENDALPTSLKKFIEEMKPGQMLLDFGCGVGDTLIHASKHDIFSIGIEMPGKIPFISHRIDKLSPKPILNTELRVELVNRSILSSVLDHIPNPVSFAKKICSITAGPIWASPCIDETYDRPMHNKTILKQVPAAFEVIREHNAPFVGTSSLP